MSLILLDKFLSDGVDMKADVDQRFVIEDLAAVEDEGRLLHWRVDLLVVQSPKKISKIMETELAGFYSKLSSLTCHY